MSIPDEPKKMEAFTVEQRARLRGQPDKRYSMLYISLPFNKFNHKFKITVEEIPEP